MMTIQKVLLITLATLLVIPGTALSFEEKDSETVQKISSNECVILLHGLGRTRYSMKKIEQRLERLGYTVWNEGYPSTKKSIRSLVSGHITPAVEWTREKGAEKIHFVTHSLGGILLRVYLQENTLPAGSRVVMVSPPNRGSEVADKLKPFSFYKWLMGPAGQELGTDSGSIPNSLKPVAANIGIIAGSRSMEPWFSLMIPGRDDGKVAVDSTKLEEMNDFLEIPSTHPFIMTNREVINQVAHYLQNGQFQR